PTITGPSAKVFRYEAVQEPEKQDQDNRRDVNAAKIREDAPDRPQQRLGHAPQKVSDRRDNAVVSVHDAKSDEPAQHRLGDQQPYVDRDHRMNETQKGIHLNGDLGSKWRADRTVRRGGLQAAAKLGFGPGLAGNCGTRCFHRNAKDTYFGLDSSVCVTAWRRPVRAAASSFKRRDFVKTPFKRWQRRPAMLGLSIAAIFDATPLRTKPEARAARAARGRTGS